jgi:hypothetical protein
LELAGAAEANGTQDGTLRDEEATQINLVVTLRERDASVIPTASLQPISDLGEMGD